MLRTWVPCNKYDFDFCLWIATASPNQPKNKSKDPAHNCFFFVVPPPPLRSYLSPQVPCPSSQQTHPHTTHALLPEARTLLSSSSRRHTYLSRFRFDERIHSRIAPPLPNQTSGSDTKAETEKKTERQPLSSPSSVRATPPARPLARRIPEMHTCKPPYTRLMYPIALSLYHNLKSGRSLRSKPPALDVHIGIPALLLALRPVVYRAPKMRENPQTKPQKPRPNQQRHPIHPTHTHTNTRTQASPPGQRAPKGCWREVP